LVVAGSYNYAPEIQQVVPYHGLYLANRQRQ